MGEMLFRFLIQQLWVSSFRELKVFLLDVTCWQLEGEEALYIVYGGDSELTQIF